MSRVSIGKEVTVLARQIRQLRGQYLKDEGCIVGPAHFHVFIYIAKNEGCTGKQAAAGIGSDKTHIAKSAKKLAALGLIEIWPDETDARYKRMRLTDKGGDELRRLEAAHMRISETLSRGMDASQIAGFMAAAGTMQRNVEESLR